MSVAQYGTQSRWEVSPGCLAGKTSTQTLHPGGWTRWYGHSQIERDAHTDGTSHPLAPLPLSGSLEKSGNLNKSLIHVLLMVFPFPQFKTMKLNNNTVTLECLALLHICKWWTNCHCYYRCFVETEGGAKLIHKDHMVYGTVQLQCIPPDLFAYITRSWWVQSLLTLAIWLCYLYCTLYPSVTFIKHMLGPWGSWKYCACE